MNSPKSHYLPAILTLLSSASIALSASYQVKSGDTLWRISKKHKVTVEAIQRANKLPDASIELGQILTIPDSSSGKPITADTAQTVSPTKVGAPKLAVKKSAVTHRVTKGESLWGISRKYKISVDALKKRNKMKNNVIEVDQILLITPPKFGPSIAVSPQLPKEVIAPKQEQVEKTLPNKEGQNTAAKEVKQPVLKEKTTPESKQPADGELKPETLEKPTPDSTDSVSTEPLVTKGIPKAVIVEEPELREIKAHDPLLPVPEVVEPPKPKGLALLSSKQREAVTQQILLDRSGLGPGIIDGYMGSFTKTSMVLAQQNRPEESSVQEPLLREALIPAAIKHYINADLPGSGKRPDFKQATADQCLMMYKTPLELLAERYHSSEKLLEKLNPEIDFKSLAVGSKILVPNVSEFKIEEFMDSEGKAVTHRYLRSSRRATRVDVDYRKNRIMVWYNNGAEGAQDELLASFPVTTNIKKGPKSQRTIAYFAPAPTYMRKKTGLKLQAGPNSPVGIVWAKLGDGFGIHGTSDGSGNGYNTSSGCIRLSNWDMAIFVKIVPSKTKVNFITEAKIAANTQPDAKPSNVSMVKK